MDFEAVELYSNNVLRHIPRFYIPEMHMVEEKKQSLLQIRLFTDRW